MDSWLYFIGFIGVVVALPTDLKNAEQLLRILSNTDDVAKNAAIENLLLEALEDFRGTMITGADDVPVLDPFQLEHLRVDDATVPIPGAFLELHHLTVSKLSTFVINSLSVDQSGLLPRYRIILDADVPSLDIDVENYDLSLIVSGLNFFGNGEAKIEIVKPAIEVDVLVNMRFGLLAVYANLLECRIAVGVDDIHLAIKGLFNDPSVDEFVNAVLKNVVLDILEFFADDISDIISPIVKDEANNILSTINLIDFIGS